MTEKLRALLVATVISVSGLAAYLSTTVASAGPTLQIVQGSKELEKLVASIELSKPEELYLQWTTDQPKAAGGTWKVTNVTAGNKLVASGESGPAPAVGHFARFTIPANAFLHASPPATPIKFNIAIVAHNGLMQPLGNPSPAVVVSQVPEGPSQPPDKFGDSAMFPSVELLDYREKIGVVPQTQLHFAGADIILRVSNPRPSTLIRKSSTDPIWLNIKDNSLLMRENTPVRIPIDSLKAGDEKIVSVHLDAILPPATSQLPEDKQYAQWSREYRDRCGVDLRTVMDWRGPQAKAPLNDHLETILFPNSPICANQQCVRTCKMAESLHNQLDGNVVGYSFFVGLYPKFEAYGEGRTSADSPKQSFVDFTTKTKIPVASVSKIVTTIAALRILDQHGIALDKKIGPYLPATWSSAEIDPDPGGGVFPPVSDYFKNITFRQLLSQHSGIMDYGNVPVGSYATLRRFFSQDVSNSSTTSCQPSTVEQPSDPINPNPGNPQDKNCGDPMPGVPCRCYSNYNFDIFRILLPKVAGFPEDPNPFTRPQTFADQYVKLVQQNVFDLVGQKNVDCKPPSGSKDYAFAYQFPGSRAGYDWGDVSFRCGSAGWYLSVEDMARVLLSINAKDGKILSAAPGNDQFEIMRKGHLGWDLWGDDELEKNGGWNTGCDSAGNNCETTISTSIAVFGPVTGPRLVAVLFMNSDISGGPSDKKIAQYVLKKARDYATTSILVIPPKK